MTHKRRDMSEIKDPKRLAIVERCLEDYFHDALAPVMDKVEKVFRENRVQEMRDHMSSPAGLLSGMTGPVSDSTGMAETVLQMTGEWSSKTAEDYAEECRSRFADSTEIRERIGLLTDEWRRTVVAEVGQERYDALSHELGTDLASAYMDYRIGDMMTDRMAAREIPQSSADYILRKASENSIMGLTGELSKSALDHEIDRRAEAAYAPGLGERAAGRLLGAGMDAVLTCGSMSWTSLARFVGYDAAIGAGIDAGEKIFTRKDKSVEECISKGLFDSRRDVFGDVRHLGRLLDVEGDAYGAAIMEALDGQTGWWYGSSWNGERAKIPAAVMEDYRHAEEEIRQDEERLEEEPKALEESPAPSADIEAARTSGDGWGTLLSSFRPENMGEVGQNMGYVMAMLPDLLVGMLTGRSTSFRLKDNVMPLAAIMAGLFVRNPILKLLLIGVGGGSIISRAGQEIVREGRETQQTGTRYKVYQDEPLNSRIESPVLRNGCLVMTIDKVPCSIRLPDSVIGAYEQGALPLNRLANAVLEKADSSRQLVRERFENAQESTESRSRGIQ